MHVVGIGLSLGGPTGYAINPARDQEPRIAHAIVAMTGKVRATGLMPGFPSGSIDWWYRGSSLVQESLHLTATGFSFNSRASIFLHVE